MKIKRIRIKSYGPVTDLDIKPVSGFQLIFGYNETGKTLTVDAIIRLLSGLKTKELLRVEEPPEGEIILDKKGKIITITRRTKRPYRYLGLEEPHDLKDIYIIRDSDLRISPDTDLMKRLVGIETREIERIRDGVLRLGRLSAKRLELSDQYDRIRSRYEKSKELIREMRSYLKEAEEQKLDQLEIASTKLRQELTGIDREIKDLEEARRVEDYNRLSQAWEEFHAAEKKVAELEVFGPAQLDLLLRHQSTIEHREEDLKLIEERVKQQQEYQKELIQKKEELILTLPEKGVEERITRIKERYEQLPLPFPILLTKSLPFVFLPFLSLATLFYFRVGLSGLTLLFGLSGLALAAVFLYAIFRSVYIDVRKRQLRREAEALGISLEGEEPIEIIHSFGEEVQKKVNQLSRIDAELNLISTELEENQRNRHRIENEIRVNREKLIGEFNKLGINGIDDFSKRMEEKKRYEKILARARQSLIDYFNSSDTRQWKEGLEKLASGLSRVKVRFDRDRLEKLKGEHQLKTKTLEECLNRLSEHKVRLKDFERRAGRLGIAIENEPDWSVETIDGLKRILSMLEEFVTRIDQNTEASRCAIRILDSLSQEDEVRLSDLLSGRLRASQIFAEITDGRYQKIRYEPERKSFLIIQRDGGITELERLSKGTFDQLYLAVRIAIAEGIGEGPRFMIMDDPFLSSDRKRLERQFEILKGLIGRGWQIIYFTVKDEIVELAERFIRAKPFLLSQLL